MKRLRLLEFMIAALLLSAAHLAAQCTPVFSFSVYNDGSLSADQTTIYGYTTTEDTSTLCSCVHSAYTAIAAVYDPNGTLLGDSDESGFSSSVSALVDGVSGNYQVNGAGVAYCSCLQGYFGGAGIVYPIAVSCPTTISISSQTPAVLSAGNVSGGILTGVGMIATLTLGPGSPASYNGVFVNESITEGPPGACPSSITPASVCTGSDQFQAGPGSGANYYGTTSPNTGNGQFWDEHGAITGADVLSGKDPGYFCTQTCTQTYRACLQQIGSFTLTFKFTQSTIGTTPVALVSVGEQ
jgi:hypothetical protein